MATANESKIDTIIGNASEVHGDIKVDGSVLVAGRVEGNVSSRDFVRVVESAVITGNLTAKSAIIAGRVEGNVHCQTKVQLGKNASLLGDLRAERLVIEEGAVFTGKSEMPVTKAEEPSQLEIHEKSSASGA
ncbi:MAG: polymer-forming cytoskeletal protein [Candidatus Marinimicrobia bacterium]|nr:polymer-forming cytoskeletal protein [Candidatus Neomarinimicrobiota bacterium]MCF7829888.1 polymer-forming cytoskeletal protein [Candidatus Neomarinimicrobiota bacterium]MCF7879149.1 polymer-forming cytoskeletal protein [Candidatus Neomarinimicrobiota bacterium]